MLSPKESKTPPPKIRVAYEPDWAECLRMSKAFHAFSPYRDYPFDDDKVRILFDLYKSNPRQVVVILAEVQDKPIGLLVGSVSELYFSKVKVGGEIIWWVDEEYRKTRAGINLFHAFEYWSTEVGAQVLSGVNTEGTTDVSKFYLRNGYHLAESTFIKRLNDKDT